MTVTLPRTLSVTTNPAGLLAAAGAVYAAATMIYNAIQGHGVIDTGVIVAAIGAVGALLARQAVTPVADPKNGAGVPLVPAGTLTSLAPGQYTQTADGAVVRPAGTLGGTAPTVVTTVTAPPAAPSP